MHYKNKVQSFFEGKDICLLGFGREGKSSYHLIRSLLPKAKICVCDGNTKLEKELMFFQDANLVWSLGQTHLDQIPKDHFVLKSPGIKISPSLEDELGPRLSSQTDVFLELFGKQTIGITGTKGKSTTSSAIAHSLRALGKNALLLGNIGVPCFEGIAAAKPECIFVFELSSHQLQFVRHSPHIAVLLNIFPEHLDHYESFQHYAESKKNIYRFAESEDHLILGDEALAIENCAAQTQIVPQEEANALKPYSNLPGVHNLINLMVTEKVCRKLGFDQSDIRKTFKTFSGLEHRLEVFYNRAELCFVNDSISTIPEATIAALKAFPKTDVLFLGGYDRGLEYQKLEIFLKHCNLEHIFLFGPLGLRIFEEEDWQFENTHIAYFPSLEDAMKNLIGINFKSGTCLFSPAASSYDAFKDFQERGQFFKTFVNQNF